MPQPQGWHHRTEIRTATEIGQAAHVFDQVTGTTLRYSQPTGGTPPPGRLVGWWAAREACDLGGVSGFAILLGSPPPTSSPADPQ
jgi:hypothetical protein